MATDRPKLALRKFACSGHEFVGFSRARKDCDPEFNYTVRVFREHSAIVVAGDEKGASEAFLELTGVRPSSIMLRTVVAHCEGCEVPIFADGEEYAVDPEGIHLCCGCMERE